MSSLRTQIRAHRFVVFLVLTYVLTWVWWIPATLLVRGGDPPAFVSLLVLVGGFGPFLAAIVLATATGDIRSWSRQLVSVRASPAIWAAAVAVPVVLFGATLALTVVTGWSFDSAALGPAGVLGALLLSTLIRGGLEEPGWRGYGLPVLQRRLGAFRASLVIGVVWAAWHIPLFAMPGSSQSGTSFVFYLLAVLAISVITTWLYNESGGRVLVPIAFHTTWNAISVYLSAGVTGNGILPSEASLALAAWLLAGILVYRYGTQRLSSKPLPTGGLSFDGVQSTSEVDSTGGVTSTNY
ncbi:MULTISPECIES: CPBP family intramembrane glutamic endopeptidase [Haloferax]|uniref:CPBP family intramembrane metalloprotease n=2 Tax=Haloferax TaxID=2251 RepID=A0A6G1Z5Z3_9EURY|nr:MULTISPECIES: type II CAAX endopeptidase family protein [Haloferax]KAB1189106.1 CPBP family intramembrane metalloprotease [Haloferax sp. CBA1149]MRW81838.1 CPBP family intramembrane metalloprotease [Haloferax marinisediminis]